MLPRIRDGRPLQELRIRLSCLALAELQLRTDLPLRPQKGYGIGSTGRDHDGVIRGRGPASAVVLGRGGPAGRRAADRLPRAAAVIEKTPDVSRPKAHLDDGIVRTIPAWNSRISQRRLELCRLQRVPEPGDQGPRRAASGALPRVVAALLDIAILAAIVGRRPHFRLRMAGLTMGDWRVLHIPMLAFLAIFEARLLLGVYRRQGPDHREDGDSPRRCH